MLLVIAFNVLIDIRWIQVICIPTYKYIDPYQFHINLNIYTVYLKNSRTKFVVLIFREFVLKGQTINAKFYLEVMKLLMYRIRRIRPEYHQSGQLNSLAWQCSSSHSNTFNSFSNRKSDHRPILYHPPYSSDLAPADYFLFPKLKLKIKSHIFYDIPAIQRACTE